MRHIELHPGVRSSIIGFGCAPILGAIDAPTARRAIECALEHGITHFDIARSYGYGEAERFLGDILASRRSEVVIASKFGIQATKLAAVLRPLKPILRALRKNRNVPAHGPPPTAETSSNLAGRLHMRVPLTAAGMVTSLEESLRKLRTDYLDLFFIHEPLTTLVHLDELCLASDNLKQAGKIRAWGIALTSSSWDVHRHYLQRFDIVQVDNSPGIPTYDLLRGQREGLPNIFYSPFRKRRPPDAEPSAILRRMAEDFPRSVILCSMFRESHIRANVAALCG